MTVPWKTIKSLGKQGITLTNAHNRINHLSLHAEITVKTKSSKATSSKVTKTSSQRQRDLIIAQQQLEEIEKQNEDIIRLAKRKQQLEIEQQELELQRLRKEQTLRVEKILEENRRKLPEATLA